MRHSQVADFGGTQVQLVEPRQLLQDRDLAIGDRRRRERDGGRVAVADVHLRADRSQPLRDGLFAFAFDRRDFDRSPGGAIPRIVRQDGDAGQAGLQLLHTGGGHAAVANVERAELCEVREARETGIRDLRAVQRQLLETAQLFE